MNSFSIYNLHFLGFFWGHHGRVTGRLRFIAYGTSYMREG
jgi:hypothetical protein